MALGTALAIGAAVGGSILSSSSAKKGAKNAAQAQLAATESNNALARDIYGQNKTALSPYIQSGIAPNALLSGAIGAGDRGAYNNAFRDYIGSSDYAFRDATGSNALAGGYAGGGTFQSGAALKGLQDYRTNLQAGYRGEFNNLLGNQQALGLSGASALAGVGQNYVNTISANNNNNAAAQANAALIKGQNNPLAGALGVIGGFGLNGGFG